MKTQEVRIGNQIIDSRYGRIGSVKEITARMITVKLEKSTLRQGAEEFIGIPITPSILIKLGGENFVGSKSISLKHHLFNYADYRKVWIHQQTSIEIRFVHELQNLLLFYGIEVDFKEPNF